MAPHMDPTTSNGSITPSTNHKEEKPITVLVTGFAPFQARHPINPSYEICKALPSVLPASNSNTKSNPNSSSSATGATDPPINIISHPSPIRVAYADAAALIPKLLEAYADTIDLVLHIGMASGRPYYTAEKCAHTQGYTRHRDVDGQFAPPSTPPLTPPLPSSDDDDETDDLPDQLLTSLPYDLLFSRWRACIAALPSDEAGADADVRVSHDAGRFLCDYTYATSLAWFARRNGRVREGKADGRPVMFLHVPAESDEKALERGGGVARALIRAMVGVLREGRGEERRGGGGEGHGVEMAR